MYQYYTKRIYLTSFSRHISTAQFFKESLKISEKDEISCEIIELLLPENYEYSMSLNFYHKWRQYVCNRNYGNTNITISLVIHIIRGAYKFPEFFRMGIFIDSTHMKLVPFEVISSGCNALVPFQQLLEGPMEVLL